MNWYKLRNFDLRWYRSKKAQHILALALVGWYLMIPPPKQIGSSFQTNFKAPIEKWAQIRRFKQKSECEATRAAYAKNPPGGVTDMLSSKQEERALWNAAQCVSTNDPRIVDR